MNRRDFFGALGGFVIGAGPTGPITPAANTPIPVQLANGSGFLVGVATETVHAGDFVQIQTYGPTTV